MAKELTREMLWEAGAQFGHQTKRWNPKMKPYIYGEKNKVHIIDLQQTLWRLEDVKKLMATLATKKGKILFVGTKKQAKWIVKDAAERSENFYVNQRWLGGTLTNLKTIHLRVKRLWNIERQEKNGELKLLPKKEQILIKKEKEKLEKFLGGIKGMKELPQALFVVDPKEEYIAVKEAQKLRIHVIAICDTNVDPDGIDYIIPANDDTTRAIAIITHHIADLYGDAIGLKMPEPQFKPSEFVRREGDDNRSDRREFGKRDFNRPDRREQSGPRPVTAAPVAEKSVAETAPVVETAAEAPVSTPVEKAPVVEATNSVFAGIEVVDNDLEKSLTKLKVDQLEKIASEVGLKKAKKAEMIEQLTALLQISNNQIVKK